MSVLRMIETDLQRYGASILPCFGRNALFEVFSRRHEYPKLKVAFLADLDMYVVSGIPLMYKDVTFTDGYCIENDIYLTALEKLLTSDERRDFLKCRRALVQWMAFECCEHMAGRDAEVARHSNEVICLKSHCIDKGYIARRSFVEPDRQWVQFVSGNRATVVRGKQLFQILVRFLSRSKRSAKYSYMNLQEMAIRLGPSRKYKRLVKALSQQLSKK